MPFSFNRVGWVWIVSMLCLLWAGAGETAHVDPVSTAPPETGPITANGQSFLDALSRDGRWTAWHSLATNVLTDQSDSNNGHDVFLRAAAQSW